MNVIVNTEIPKKVYIVITIFSIILGLFFLYFATNCFIKVYILKTCNYTEATVISSSMEKSDRDQEYYRSVDYTYSVDGVKYSNRDKLWWKWTDINLKENDKIGIYYDINNPAESKVYHISYLIIILTILLLIFMPLLLKERLKYDE